MDFTLPESGEDVRGLARDIAGKISTPERVADLESSSATIDTDLWRELGAAGLLGLEVSSAAAGERGGDLSAIENDLVAEELGRALARVPFAAHACAALPVIATRADALRDSIVGPAAGGEVVLTVAFEEDLGVDVTAPATTATRDGDRLTVTGTKVNVPYAEAADHFVVNAVGPDGPIAVVVPARSTGLSITATDSTGKIPTAQVDLTDVVVDADHVLDGGLTAVHDIADRFTLAVCAEQSGVVTRALELAAEYAREREQFGRAIGSFQAVKHHLADVAIAVEMARPLVHAAALGIDGLVPEDTDVRRDVAAAKVAAGDAAHLASRRTLQVLGAIGYTTEHDLSLYLTKTRALLTAWGTPAALRQRVLESL
jgi:3-oxocholest-4-en-26-oyl-CoA dehydrogenase beta subunit